ncbi:MAG: type II secretion system major pseudopilin GspG [Thermoguttaceae bacterium]
MRNINNRTARLARTGFTLVEVMIVLSILMVIASLTVVTVTTAMANAKKREAKIYVDQLDTPLQQYYLDHDHFPTTTQGLNALINPPDDVDVTKGEWPYLPEKKAKNDPWGQPYQYECPGQNNPRSYDLWSLGPPGSNAPIGNW